MGQKVINKLKEMRGMQIAVGVGKDYNHDELLDFASDEAHILHYDDMDQLVEAGQQIINLIQEGCKSNDLRDVSAPPDHFFEDNSDSINSYDSSNPENYGYEPYGLDISDEDPSLDITEDFLDWPY